MKNTLLFVLATSLLLACQSQPQPTQPDYLAQLVGRYHVVTVAFRTPQPLTQQSLLDLFNQRFQESPEVQAGLKTAFLALNADHSYQSLADSESENGTWQVSADGDSLTTTPQPGTGEVSAARIEASGRLLVETPVDDPEMAEIRALLGVDTLFACLIMERDLPRNSNGATREN
jgi:hypothetical protein